MDARAGNWTTDEDSTLTDAVEKHNGEDWVAIAALVPGRTKTQCNARWHNALYSKSDETTARAGKWTTDEDSTLTDAVEKHNGEDWVAIAALVPGRTKTQCNARWHNALHSKSDETTARVGKWTTDEDSTLKDAVEKYSGKNWIAISSLVPGRTKNQCHQRWFKSLDPSRITITDDDNGTTNDAPALG
jgi:myb proto-oncogene protein